MKYTALFRHIVLAIVLGTGTCVAVPVAFAAHVTGVSSNISSENAERHAWNDVIGWIDFGHDVGAVEVTSTKLKGFAHAASIGQIGLDCATPPSGSPCPAQAGQWFVANDGNGGLSGWAWNDIIGWISFCGSSSASSGATGGCPPSPTYQVTISAGDFHGWAWNDVVGWISFNSIEGGGSIPYKVKTTWTSGPAPQSGTLISSVFDTCLGNSLFCLGGAALNSVMWQGSLNGGTVQLQVAASMCMNGTTNWPDCDSGDGWDIDALGCNVTASGQGDETCFLGPDGTSSDLFSGNQNISLASDPGATAFTNKRFFRYKVTISGNAVVNDVIMNWSH